MLALKNSLILFAIAMAVVSAAPVTVPKKGKTSTTLVKNTKAPSPKLGSSSSASKKIEEYANLGAQVSEKVAQLNFKNSLQQAQNSVVTKSGDTTATAARH